MKCCPAIKMSIWKKLNLFFRLSWKISPGYIGILLLYTLAGSGQILTNVVLPKYLIDELIGGKDVKRLILFGGLIVGSNLFFAWFSQFMQKQMTVKNAFMNLQMELELGKKIMNLSYYYLEDPYYLDLKERAVFASVNQRAMEAMITHVADVMKNIVTLLGLIIIMFTLSPIYVLLQLILIGLMLAIQKHFMKYQKSFFESILPVNRKYGYYVNLTYDPDLQKDIRLYGMAPMLGDKVTWYNREITTWFAGCYRKQGFFMGIYGIINDLQATLAYGYVGIRVITTWFGQRIGLGSFTMYVSSAISFSKSIMELGQAVMSLQQVAGYLDPFMELMDLPEEGEQKGLYTLEGAVESVRFEHVSFRYPKTEQEVLKDISFEIKRGEKISIVGLNGAGKTTLIKLLCRLYQPIEGTIYINGHDIFQYEHTSYMKQIAAIFQDYRLFAFTIEENITCRKAGEDEKKADQLIAQVGLSAKMEDLPDGMKTQLGKSYEEEATELSGGQAQKVAIARALYKEASLIILDEPTSALDPLAEAEIYENFNYLAGGKTAVYISHRMSSSVFCDKILVLDGGSVSDFASHKELMEKKEGLYYKLFHSQAVNYQIE